MNNQDPNSNASPEAVQEIGATSNTQVIDMTNITKEKGTLNILPSSILAANLFNGSNKLGSIEVDLPILNSKAITNPISSVSELEAKTISGSMHVYMEKNLRLFYNFTEFDSALGIDSFEEFCRRLTDTDFQTIVFGSLKSSFKTLQESSFVCTNAKCNNTDPAKVFKFTIETKNIVANFPKAPFVSPSNDHTRDLFIDELNGIKINYKFDSIGDKLKILSTKSNEEIRNNLAKIRTLLPKAELITTYIDSIEIDDVANQKIIKLTSSDEIIVFLSRLNTSAKEVINNSTNTYINHMNSWKPTFSTELECPHCKNKMTWEDIDLIVEFFLKLSTLY